MVQLKLDGHKVHKNSSTLLLAGNCPQLVKQKAVCLFDSLNFQKLGISIKVMRGNNPGRQIARVEGSVFQVSDLLCSHLKVL